MPVFWSGPHKDNCTSKHTKNTEKTNHMEGIRCQASLTRAGLAGGVTLVAGLGRALLVVAWRAALQALSPLPQVDVLIPTAQTVPVAATPTLAASGVTAIANHGRGVSKVTAEQSWFTFQCICMNKEGRAGEYVYVYLSEQTSTQPPPCLKNPGLQSTHCTLWRPTQDLQLKWQRSHTRSSLSSA